MPVSQRYSSFSLKGAGEVIFTCLTVNYLKAKPFCKLDSGPKEASRIPLAGQNWEEFPLLRHVNCMEYYTNLPTGNLGYLFIFYCITKILWKQLRVGKQ